MNNVIDFTLSINNWNITKVVGLPENGSFCFIVFGNDSEGYTWSIGGYNESEKLFYCNLGFGGMTVSKDDVIAWKQWEEVGFDIVN